MVLPGCKQQHVTPYSRPSRAVHCVRPHRPCFDAEYGAESGRTRWAEIEPMLMIRPRRCGFMMRRASRVQRNGPVRFTAITLFQASSESSSSGPPSNAPALLTSKSSRLNSRRTMLEHLRDIAFACDVRDVRAALVARRANLLLSRRWPASLRCAMRAQDSLLPQQTLVQSRGRCLGSRR